MTKPAPQAHLIASDAEAIEVAREVARSLAAGASDLDRERRIPTAEMNLLSASGLMGITVPREYGGAGVSTETLVKVFQIVSAADSAVGQLPQNHFFFVDAIAQEGSPEQKAFFFAELLAGRRFGNAQAERGGGSALNLATRLLPDGRGGHVLNGTKYYCTGAIVAHWIPVAAIDDEGRSVIAYVRRDAEGVEVAPDWNAMGQRVTFSGTATFTDVAVPGGHVVPQWRLTERPTLYFSLGALLHAAIDVGLAEGALADARAALLKRSRPRLGAPVASAQEDPLILRRLGRFVACFHAAEALLLRAARLFDTGAEIDEAYAARVAVAVSEAKAFVEDVVMEITNELFVVLGSSAVDESFNLNRHWRNARTHTVHDANEWRYVAVGDNFLTGRAPGSPVRRLDPK